MQLTKKIKIKPSVAQEVVLRTLSERCRLVYNFALSERKQVFEETGKGVSYLKQQNDLPALKKKYVEYGYVYSKVLQHTLRTLDADYKSFFALRENGDEDAKPPKYKGKKHFVTMVYNQSGFKFGEGFIELAHKHPTKTKLRFVIPEKFVFRKVYQVSIFEKDNDFWLSVVYDEIEKPFTDNGLVQAFDLGTMKHTAVNLDGKFKVFKNNRSDKYWQLKTEKLQSRIDHCKKYSRKYKRLKKSLDFMTRKSAYQLLDSQHKFTRKVVDNTKASVIVVGDLDVKQMAKSEKGDFKSDRSQNRGVHNTGHLGRTVSFLTYKAKRVGKRIIEDDERYTTQECCVCRHRHKMPTWNRVYICEECGNTIDRDKNSAINIMCNFLSRNGLWKAYELFVRNLRQTGLNIASRFDIDLRYSQEAPPSKIPEEC